METLFEKSVDFMPAPSRLKYTFTTRKGKAEIDNRFSVLA